MASPVVSLVHRSDHYLTGSTRVRRNEDATENKSWVYRKIK